MIKNKETAMKEVLWNGETDLCIGLVADIDMEEFIEIAKRKYEELTGNKLPDGIFSVSQKEDVWVLELI